MITTQLLTCFCFSRCSAHKSFNTHWKLCASVSNNSFYVCTKRLTFI